MCPKAADVPEETKAWRDRYRAATDAIERIEARELAAMTEEEALRQILSLRPFGSVWRERPEWSGLVEQQAILRCQRRS